jgi:hypothetical protein
MTTSKVVVAGAVLACSHQGQAKVTTGSSQLKVDSNAVVVSGQEVGVSFASGPGVVTPCPYATNAGPSPCTATVAATAGVSTNLKVGGLGVLLDTATGSAINANDPNASWKVSDPGQSKLTAN